MRVIASSFDSEQYDLKVGRVVAEPFAAAAEFDAAIAATNANFDVVFVRAEQDSPLDLELRRRGEVPADVLVTSTLDRLRVDLTAPGLGLSPPSSARFVVESHDRVTGDADVSAIEAISAGVLRRSHLHSDSRLPVERTQRYYAAWARNNATGRAQRTLIARASGHVIGYLSIFDANGHVAIDLVAVSAQWQGQGVGHALLAELGASLAERPEIVATVGTQVDNPALKLYRRFGYIPSVCHATYHLWARR